MRELNYQTNKRSGSERSNKKQYVYFTQLSFLKPSVDKRKTSSSMDANPEENLIQDDLACNTEDTTHQHGQLAEEQVDDVSEVPQQQDPSSASTSYAAKLDVRPASLTSRKRNRDTVMATEMRVLQDMSKRLASKPANPEKKNSEVEDDPDRLFLLSLVSDIKKVHEDDRLEMKGEIINIISKWKRVRQTAPYQHNSNQFHGNASNIDQRNGSALNIRTNDIHRNGNSFEGFFQNGSLANLQSPSILFPSQNSGNQLAMVSPADSDATYMESPAGSSENTMY